MQTTQLARYDAARFALQAAISVDEVKDIRDKAEAMAAYARQAKDIELVQWATEIKCRAERRAGQMLVEMPKNTGVLKVGTNLPQSHDTTTAPTLSEMGISKDQSSRWQKLSAIPEDKFEEAVTAAKEVAGEVTTAYLLRVEKNASNPHVANNSGENEWYTPIVYLDAARRVMGVIDTDPASSVIANRAVKAEQFFTFADDGLKQEWNGNVWMNPPYAQPLMGLFAEAVSAKFESGEITQAIILVNNATETKWFQRMLGVSSAVCFPETRIKFIDVDGNSSGAPLQGQAVIYMGSNAVGFTKEFCGFGIVLLHDVRK